MDASASRVPSLETEPEEVLGLSQLPPELLLAVLSLLPPRTLLGRCRQVCRRWRALVDAPGLWLKILARDHRALWPVVRSCLPRADAASACLLGRFCARGPIGRNLLCKREREGGEPRKEDRPQGSGSEGLEGRDHTGNHWTSPWDRGQLEDEWYHKKKQVLDLEEEGFWPELLDSGKIEICFSDWWTDQQDINSIYRLTIQLLDANQAILDQFSTTLFPIRNRRHTSFLEVSHVFSNLKTGVRFVSLEHWVREMEFCSKHYGIYLPNSSVIVQVVLS
ncbi:F-box only protein 27 [Camelus dromedarius]|uniref:F-box only protein 27 n=1 Tax=Camelus dromedarius TaxID=9838 RepID=A0A5N4DT35_CAMDR|nr:F-box only protein 27 [Camelus dromedarius]